MTEEATGIGVEVKTSETSKSLQVKMVIEGIVKLNPDHNSEEWSSKRYTVDFEKAKEMLQSPQAKPEKSPIVFGEEQIKAEGERSFRKVVKAFVDHGDIPTQLAVQIGRVVKPSDILIHDEDFARFLFFDDSFPESAEKRADLEIGTEYINGWALKDMREATMQADLNLTDDQLFQLALRNGISHEYGHAIERVIILLRGAGIEGEDAWKKKLNIKDELEQSIYDSIAPRPELQKLLEGQPTDGYAVDRKRTTSERIAVGFESLGTRYALEEMGIDNQTIELVLNNLDKFDQDRLNKSVDLIKLLSSSSLNIQDLADARLDVYGYLKDRGEQELYEPLAWGLDTRSLGYFFPLTKDELQQFTSQWMPKV